MSISSKAILIAVVIVLPLSLVAQNYKFCTKHLNVVEAVQEKWNPGVLKNNSEQAGGIKYQITVKVKKGGYITFKNLITETETLEIEIVKDGKRNFSGFVNKGDEVVIIARTDKIKPQPSPDPTTIDTLKQHSAPVGIVYSLKNKMYLHPLKELKLEQSGKLIQ